MAAEAVAAEAAIGDRTPASTAFAKAVVAGFKAVDTRLEKIVNALDHLSGQVGINIGKVDGLAVSSRQIVGLVCEVRQAVGGMRTAAMAGGQSTARASAAGSLPSSNSGQSPPGSGDSEGPEEDAADRTSASAIRVCIEVVCCGGWCAAGVCVCGRVGGFLHCIPLVGAMGTWYM